ncbi:MAG: hypothetical protein WBQ79_18490, partial [Acidobacteriaceae bacterium]
MDKMDTIMQHVNEANSLISRGEYTAARNAIRNSPYYPELSNDSAPLYLAEMNSFLAEGNFERAMNIAERLDRPGMNYLVNLYRLSYLAQIQQRLGKKEDALETVEIAKLIALQHEREVDSGTLCEITARRGYILCDLERWSDALAVLAEAKHICVGDDEKS